MKVYWGDDSFWTEALISCKIFRTTTTTIIMGVISRPARFALAYTEHKHSKCFDLWISTKSIFLPLSWRLALLQTEAFLHLNLSRLILVKACEGDSKKIDTRKYDSNGMLLHDQTKNYRVSTTNACNMERQRY